MLSPITLKNGLVSVRTDTPIVPLVPGAGSAWPAGGRLLDAVQPASRARLRSMTHRVPGPSGTSMGGLREWDSEGVGILWPNAFDIIEHLDRPKTPDPLARKKTRRRSLVYPVGGSRVAFH